MAYRVQYFVKRTDRNHPKYNLLVEESMTFSSIQAAIVFMRSLATVRSDRVIVGHPIMERV